MSVAQHDLAALIGSRICHDLISPLSAIGNGIELLGMCGGAPGPEVALISDSVDNANARIRFFRVAFGAAGAEAILPARELHDILAKMTSGSRFDVIWGIEGDLPRAEVKLAFLLMLCFEAAMPWGGELQVTRHNEGWKMTARADRMKVDPDLWAAVEQKTGARAVAPAEVQFLLAPLQARDLDRTIKVSRQDGVLVARF